MPLAEAHASVVPTAQERRRHRREDLCFRIRFQPLDHAGAHDGGAWTGAFDASDETDEGHYLDNVSNGGLGICGHLAALRGWAPPEGSYLKIEIESPRSPATVRCVGRLAWFEVQPERGLYHAGVSFIAVHAEDLARLQRDAA